MALQSITNIDIDFYDKKYILINAKQYDNNSRFLNVTCYNHGKIMPINSGEHAAYIRYKKADENSVFNFCEIDRKGKILVELTEQMLASEGVSCADLVIVNKGHADVNTETGEIVVIENASILSTMTFFIDVSETATENSNIESTYEFNLLNTKLEEYWADFEEVIRTSRSYAIGNAGGIRENEDYDNAKYYYEQSLVSSNNAKTSEQAAYNSEQNARTYMNNAETYMNSASISESNAEIYKNNAKDYMDNTEIYKNNAQEYMDNAKTSADNSKASEDNAKLSETNAFTSEENAYNYYLQTEAITNGLNGAFLPMGTISFSELTTLKENNIVAAGYLYNISDNFITDETFKVGDGIEYEAGTNVYYTADGYWDCLVGTTVTGIKGDNESDYRKGNVNITANNIGAVATSDIASVDEVKEYLGI